MKDNWCRNKARSDIGECGRSYIGCSRGVHGNCRRNGRIVIYISPEFVSFDLCSLTHDLTVFFPKRQNGGVDEGLDGTDKVQLRAGVEVLAEAK